jgi:hypothetical protein
MTPDIAYENFLKIYNEYQGKRGLYNEADTRAKIIDYILRDTLGWGESFVKRENHTNAGYTDYELLINESPVIVLEAKKSGEYFEIPQSKTNRAYKINGSISSVSNLMDAINQVHQYCTELGCKYAAVFNGYQLVIFPAISIGSPWRDNYCVIYNSLDDIKENFNQFWNTLAYENVIDGSLISYIEKGKSVKRYQKILSEIHNRDQSWARNELYTYIQPYCDFVFSELLDEKRTEVLKECYVYDRSSKPLTNEIKSYFTDKLPHFAEKFNIAQIYEDRVRAGQFQKEFDLKNNKLGSSAMMVLLGGIGSGKSTFIHRFFKVVIAKRENHLWFYIDFRNAPIDVNEIENFIIDKMYETWQNYYKEKFVKILRDISFNGDENNKKQYFQSLFHLATYLRFSTTIIVDNIDQHEIKFQEKIFLTAHHLKDIFKTLTILALREETFVNSTKTGVFDAYYIQKFHISSPNFLSMIIKRINFTVRLIEGSDDNIPKDNLVKYLSIIKESLGRKNQQSRNLVEFIDCVSVGNMREALRMFNNFIVSGNTNINEIFHKYDRTGSYQLSYHQFLKSIMLGEYRYYSQDRSHIMNVFDFDNSITDSPFNLLRILKYLNYRSNKRSRIGSGYVLIDDLIKIFEGVSIKKEVVIDSLLRLSGFNLVEFDNQSRTDIKNAVYTKITASGKYYINNITKEFVYLDSVFIDTPISSIQLFGILTRSLNETDLDKRLARTKCFIEYLCECEKDEHKDHPEYFHNELTNVVFCDNIYNHFLHFEKYISNKLFHSTTEQPH